MSRPVIYRRFWSNEKGPLKSFKKYPRNEKCPCGSGKKYKNCHLNGCPIPEGWEIIKTGQVQSGDMYLETIISFAPVKFEWHGMPVERFHQIIRRISNV